MTIIPSAPHILRDVDLKIGTDNYEAHVNRVAFVPTTSTVTWQGLAPSASFSGQTAATWTCELSGVQDWTTADSLSEYLFDHEGEEVTVEFTPRKGSGKTWTAIMTCAPVTVGGDVNTVPVFAGTFGLSGRPVPSVTV